MDRRLLRPGALVGHLLVLVAVLVCLRLGWWQYERAHEATGTAQNWGYALLWPCFAVAFVYMWVKFLRLERDRDVDDEAAFDEGLAEILGPSGGPDATQPSTIQPSAIGSTGPSGEDNTPEPVDADRPSRLTPGPPSRSVVLSIATVGDDDDDDPELAAYNRALAELAERDRNGAS